MNERSSRKQQELLQFIDNFIKGNGYGPSYREIMRGLGYKSVSTVAVHVDSLITKGYIRKKDHSARSIEIVSMQHRPDTQPAKPTGLGWLEHEIEQRLKDKERAVPSEIATLIDAAALLGSKKVDDFRDQMKHLVV